MPSVQSTNAHCYPLNMLDWEITPQQLLELRKQNPEIVLLDVREPVEQALGVIEGSVTMPMGDIPARVQELDPEAHIVTICHHGVRSMNVCAWLRHQGFEHVQSLRGGTELWSTTVDPTLRRY